MSKFTKNEKSKWYPLDLSANVYPTLQRKSFSSVFRLSALLTESVNPDVLQEALSLTLPRFPTFKVSLKRGIFWRYFEPNTRPGPWVEKDIINPCMPMHFKGNNRYLIRIYYYENRISLEVFHSISDGGGAVYLLRTLIATYLQLLGHSIPSKNGVLNINEAPDPSELEDAYQKYASSKVRPSRKQEKAYRFRGTLAPFYSLNIICGIMSTKAALTVAKNYGVSITEYFNAVLIYALLEQQQKESPRKIRPVKIAMPVNLRRFYKTKTLRNFITMVYPSIDPRLGEYTFDEILKQVHYYMRYHINEKFLNAEITTNAYTRHHPVIRLIPLFIKDLTVRSFYKRVQDLQSSAGLTNMGVITVPDSMKPFISRFDVLMGQPFSPRTNCAIASYEDTLTISFASSILETDVEKLFFRKLVKDGIPIKIESNRN